MIDDYELAGLVTGKRRAEARASQIGTTVMYGRAVADSENGSVLVEMDGETVLPDGAEGPYVELPTSPAVKQGDTVMITLTGGRAKSPMVTAVVNSGDRIEAEIEGASHAYTDDSTYYLLSATAPATPTDETWEQAGWSTTEPIWSESDTRTLYASRRIELVDGTVTWSAPAEVSANASLDVMRNAIISNVSETYATKYEAADGNLIDQSELVDGYIKSDGSWTRSDAAKEWCTPFIPVTPGQILSFSVYLDETPSRAWQMWIAYCFYDAQEAKIGSRVAKYGTSNVDLSMSYDSITVPDGAAYIRCSWRSYDVANHAVLAEVAATKSETVELSSQITQTAIAVDTLFASTLADTTVLYYANSSATPPAAPTAQEMPVTSTSTAGGAWTTVVPEYDVSYPYYFTCTEYKRRAWNATTEQYDDAYTCGPVVYDAALTQSLMTANEVKDTVAYGGNNLLKNSWRFTSADWALIRSTVPAQGVLRITPTTSAAFAKYKVDYLDYSEYGDGMYTVSFEAREVDDGSGKASSNTMYAYLGYSAEGRDANYFQSAYDRYGSKTVTEITSNWKRFSVTFKVPDDFTTGSIAALTAGSNLSIEPYRQANLLPVEVRNIQLERGAIATEYSMTKGEAEAIAAAAGNPNLFPWFSDYIPLAGAANWWYWETLTAVPWVRLENGWVHYERTTGDGSWSPGFRPRPQDFIEPDTDYTVLIEVRNLSISGDGTGDNTIAFSNNSASQLGAEAASINLNTQGEGAYRFIRHSRPADYATELIRLIYTYVGQAARTTLSFDMRISIYKGDYQGDYKPFVFPQYEGGSNLFALSAIPEENKGYYLGNTGQLDTAATAQAKTCAVSDWIPVTPGTFYALSVDIGPDLASLSYDSCCYYDSSKTFIARFSYHANGANPAVRGNFLCPEGAAYVRLSARGLVATETYPAASGRVKFEQGRFCSAWSPAPADVEAGIAEAQDGVDTLQTLIRDTADGTLVAKVGASVGALTNANGSFDVVALTWSGTTPTIGDALASFGTTATIGDVNDNTKPYVVMDADSFDINWNRMTVFHVGMDATTGLPSLFSGYLADLDPSVLGGASASFGSRSIASGNNSIATGNTCGVSGDGSIVVGNNSSVQGPYSGAVGDNLKVLAGTQFVCGAYNKFVGTGNAHFVVGNGENITSVEYSNAFEVYHDGSVRTGSLSARVGETAGAAHLLQDVYSAASAVVETNFYATADMVVIPIAITLQSASMWSGQKLANVPAGFEPIQIASASLWTDTNAAALVGIDTTGKITMTSGSATTWRGQLVYIRKP